MILPQAEVVVGALAQLCLMIMGKAGILYVYGHVT